MLLQQEAKEIMGNIFLVHRNNHADVFKVSNMEKYIFKRYYSLDAFSGLTICMNAVAGEADEKYISKVLKDNIRFTVVTEFLLSTFTFSLGVELIIIPIMTAITLLDVVAAQKSETVAVHKLLQSVIAFIGLCLVFQTVKVGIREYRELNMVDTLVSFFIPMVYLLFVTPLEYD